MKYLPEKKSKPLFFIFPWSRKVFVSCPAGDSFYFQEEPAGDWELGADGYWPAFARATRRLASILEGEASR